MRPTDRKYLKSHEWCKIENGIATIGITDFAVSHLSDLVFLDLPEGRLRSPIGRASARSSR
jgi:glycine cleavage system H protein